MEEVVHHPVRQRAEHLDVLVRRCHLLGLNADPGRIRRLGGDRGAEFIVICSRVCIWTDAVGAAFGILWSSTCLHRLLVLAVHIPIADCVGSKHWDDLGLQVHWRICGQSTVDKHRRNYIRFVDAGREW